MPAGAWGMMRMRVGADMGGLLPAQAGAGSANTGTGGERIPRVFHGLDCGVPASFCAVATHRDSETPTNPALTTTKKVAARLWGKPGRARTGLGRGGVGM